MKIRPRVLLICLAVGLAVASTSLFWACRKGPEPAHYNLLLITLDTLRTDRVSCYNPDHVQTPNIDGLAAKSLVFSRAFAHTTTTLPSHTNILLGTTPSHHGVHENSNFIVRDELVTLAEVLKQQGYATGAFIGSYSLDARFGLDQGFDHYDGNYDRKSADTFGNLERRAEAVTESAWQWLEGRESPWFLWVHCFDPHDPYDPPEPFKSQFSDRLYEGEVAYMDSVLGEFFQKLESLRVLENTIIILTGDHGESLGQHGEKTHGFFAYNSTLWIPLMMYFPGIQPGRSEDYVGHIDIFPTVCKLTGIEPPDHLQGRSLVPALMGRGLPEREIYFESLYPYYTRGWAPIRGLIDNRIKYIDSPIPEFYDLAKDFHETDNLIRRQNPAKYQKQLKKVIAGQTAPDSDLAEDRFDRKTLERLKSLGYFSTVQSKRKETFGPRDDVKELLPLSNKAMEAMDRFFAGHQEEAFRLLREVLTERDDIATAYQNLADLYKRTGRLGESLQVLKLALEKVPSSYLIFYSYLNTLLDAGLSGQVIEAFEENSYRQMEYDPEIWNILGIAHYRQGNFDKAAEAYEQALVIEPLSFVVLSNLGEIFFLQSIKTEDPSYIEQSFSKLNRALELNPEYALAHNVLGKVFRHQGDMEKAAGSFEKALEFKPDLDEALYYLGMCYLDMERFSEALEKFRLYKSRYYEMLSEGNRDKLDELIRQALRNVRGS